jgi:hypothetical protein
MVQPSTPKEPDPDNAGGGMMRRPFFPPLYHKNSFQQVE